MIRFLRRQRSGILCMGDISITNDSCNGVILHNHHHHTQQQCTKRLTLDTVLLTNVSKRNFFSVDGVPKYERLGCRSYNGVKPVSQVHYCNQYRCFGMNGIGSDFEFLANAENNENGNQIVWDNEAVLDLFNKYAKVRNSEDDKIGEKTLDIDDLQNLLEHGIGKKPDPYSLRDWFQITDSDGNGTICQKEFVENSAIFLSDSPARIILVIGGPGSGKGLLSKRLQEECNVVHLSSGELLRQEVEEQTQLGNTVKDIMSRGELVSSAIMVALMKKRMQDHPGKRVLLDGFPRSPENAQDLIKYCGVPEVALHLVCDDTVLMERIMKRGCAAANTSQVATVVPASSSAGTACDTISTVTVTSTTRREDDNFYSALHRLRTFHKYHNVTLEWLKLQHVPIINLDCSGTAESVWEQLMAIGRLMRPAVKFVKKE